MYLLVDGDYLLSGFVPSSEDAVRSAVDLLLRAISDQLLQPPGSSDGATPPPATGGSAAVGAHIDLRLIFFSSAMMQSLDEVARSCLISSLRRQHFQVQVLDTVRGRSGSPIDAALCSKIAGLLHQDAQRSFNGQVASPSAGPGKLSLCLATPNAYVTTALDLAASRGCDVCFATYEGDEVAEELLSYVSPHFGCSGGVAKVKSGPGVSFVPNPAAVATALALLQQEAKDLPLSVVTQLKALQKKLEKDSDGHGMIFVDAAAFTATTPKANDAFVPPPPPPLPGLPDPFSATPAEEGSAAALPPSLPSPISGGASRVEEHQASTTSITSLPLFFEDVPATLMSPATAPPTILQQAVEPSASPPPPLVPRATLAVEGVPPVATMVPEGWAVAYSTTYQRHYYAYQTSTGQIRSTWQHPLGVEKQRELEQGVLEWQQTQQASPPPPQAAVLPEGWEERVDPRTGKTFYVDHINHQTTWKRPTVSSATPQNTSTTGITTSSTTTVASDLPPPWRMEHDPASGRPFYVNPQTRETRWERPSAVPAPAPEPAALLTDDWQPQVDPKTGRTFFVNHKTRQTSWEKPAKAVVGAPALPAPWQASVDPRTGRTFYINHDTRVTSWERPTY